MRGWNGDAAPVTALVSSTSIEDSPPRTERMIHAGAGAYLWTESGGAGAPAVLMLHDEPGMWDTTAPMAALLEDRWQVVRFDQRGGGRSGSAHAYGMNQAVADVEEVRQAHGLDEVVVAGHGFGASIALAYALQHSERLRGLVYLSGTGLGRSWHAKYAEERLRRLPGRFGARFRELSARGPRDAEEQHELRLLQLAPEFADRAESLRLARLVHAGETLAAPNEEVRAALYREQAAWNQKLMRRSLRAVRVPTLVVHGSADPRPAESLQTLVTSIPHARLEILPGVGHFPWLEQPWLVGRIVRGFLAAL